MSRLLHSLLGVALFAMPIVSLACGGPTFTATLTSDSGGVRADAGSDVNYDPIIVYFQDGGATSPDATLRDAQDGSIDATLDGPSPHDGSLDTAKDAPAPEGSVCSGLQCDGGCVPSDSRNCGTCGHDCTALPYVAAAGLSCAAGKCIYQCAPGFADCSDAGTGCSSNLSQNGNCGACGVTCTGPTPVCSGSGCTSNCSSSAPTLCGTTCVNTQTDAQNCGTCGNACTTTLAHATATCAAGACTTQCDTSLGYTSCGGACVDMSKDNNNCGACARTCIGAAPLCLKGGCVACMPGATRCSGAVPQTCDSNGAWQGGPVTVGQCGAVCAPGASQCSGNGAVLTCGTTGQWGTAMGCAQPTPSCSQGACICPSGSAVSNGVCCPSGQTGCGGSCVDVQTDNGNCGRCGHTCQGGGCAGGMCQPVVLAPGNPGSMTVDGTNVYWLDGAAGVMKCGINGCGNVPIKIASLLNTSIRPEQIAVDALNVYWVGAISTGNPQDILKCAISGCGTPFDLGLNADAFTLDPVNGNLYSIATSTGSSVYQISVNGGSSVLFAASSQYTNGITMFSGTVYWTTHYTLPGSGSTWSCPIAGCSSSGNLIASGSETSSIIVANTTGVYWTQFGAPNQRLTGTTVTTLVGAGKDLAVDATNLYWTDGTLQTCPVNACTSITNLTTLYSAAGQTSTGPIAIDATSIYWGDSAKGVMKVAKP